MTAFLLSVALLQTAAPVPVGSRRAADNYPFAVGETLEYSAKLGALSLGSGTMEVAGLDTVRGAETFRFRFTLQGRALFFRIKDVLESWTGTTDLASRRFRQSIEEDGDSKLREYEIFPDSGFFYRVPDRKKHYDTPAVPLDDAAFFYFIRTTTLEPGRTYQYASYFRKDLNPVTVRVLKREPMELPDGRKVTCLLLQPVIRDGNLFSERADARIWLTDDAQRLPVQIRSTLAFGTVTLRLKSVTPGRRESAAPAPEVR